MPRRVLQLRQAGQGLAQVRIERVGGRKMPMAIEVEPGNH